MYRGTVNRPTNFAAKPRRGRCRTHDKDTLRFAINRRAFSCRRLFSSPLSRLSARRCPKSKQRNTGSRGRARLSTTGNRCFVERVRRKPRFNGSRVDTLRYRTKYLFFFSERTFLSSFIDARCVQSKNIVFFERVLHTFFSDLLQAFDSFLSLTYTGHFAGYYHQSIYTCARSRCE